MAKHLFSGDFALRKFRKQRAEELNEQALAERIDLHFNEINNKITNEINDQNSKLIVNYQNKITELTNTIQKITQDYNKLKQDNLEFKEKITKLLETSSAVKNDKNDIKSIVNEILQSIVNQKNYVNEVVPETQNSFEKEYQEFIKALQLKQDIHDEVEKQLSILLTKISK